MVMPSLHSLLGDAGQENDPPPRFVLLIELFQNWMHPQAVQGRSNALVYPRPVAH